MLYGANYTVVILNRRSSAPLKLSTSATISPVKNAAQYRSHDSAAECHCVNH